MYSLDIPKTDEEIELEEILIQLDRRLQAAREGSAEHQMILRQMEGIRHGSEAGWPADGVLNALR